MRWQAAAIAVALVGCSSATTGSGTSGQGTPEAGSGCNQECADAFVGLALVDMINGLYNQSIAGKPNGYQMTTAPCPLGGTAVLTGTASTAPNGISTANLSWAMTSCEVTSSTATLTFNGTVQEVGTFDQSGNWSMNYSSSTLSVAGTSNGVSVGDTACAAHADYNTSSMPQITGTLCGRTF